MGHVDEHQPTFLLVHGSWHDGSCWSAVAERLNDADFPTLTPTLAGHNAHDRSGRVTHDDYVSSVLEALDTVLDPVVLVGHSFGGSVISRVAELRPERCRSLVYYSAFVPRDGERVADSLCEPMLAFLEEAATGSPDRSITLPYALFRSAFANTGADTMVEAILPSTRPRASGPDLRTAFTPSLRAARHPHRLHHVSPRPGASSWHLPPRSIGSPERAAADRDRR